MKLINISGKGFKGAGNEFTSYTSLEGRKCPPSVYIDDGNTTVFETATTDTTNSYYPSDATPTFAGASDGIPVHASGYNWTASAKTNDTASYWRVDGAAVGWNGYGSSIYVRCVLP